MPEFDIIVIGAGPAGEVLAGRTAAAGLSTAIVEERLVGGECGFYACMPSKALLHPGEILDETRRVPGAREAAGGQLAVQAVLDHRDSIISDLDDSNQVPWLKDNDISLYRGHGRIAGEKRVAVGDNTLAREDRGGHRDRLSADTARYRGPVASQPVDQPRGHNL